MRQYTIRQILQLSEKIKSMSTILDYIHNSVNFAIAGCNDNYDVSNAVVLNDVRDKKIKDNILESIRSVIPLYINEYTELEDIYKEEYGEFTLNSLLLLFDQNEHNKLCLEGFKNNLNSITKPTEVDLNMSIKVIDGNIINVAIPFKLTDVNNKAAIIDVLNNIIVATDAFIDTSVSYINSKLSEKEDLSEVVKNELNENEAETIMVNY